MLDLYQCGRKITVFVPFTDLWLCRKINYYFPLFLSGLRLHVPVIVCHYSLPPFAQKLKNNPKSPDHLGVLWPVRTSWFAMVYWCHLMFQSHPYPHGQTDDRFSHIELSETRMINANGTSEFVSDNLILMYFHLQSTVLRQLCGPAEPFPQIYLPPQTYLFHGSLLLSL